MTKNHMKNLGISLLFAALLLYALILHYSPIGIAIFAVAIGAILLVAFVYKKEQHIIEKFDLYFLIAFLCALALQYQPLMASFTPALFSQKMQDIETLQILALLGGGLLGVFFYKISMTRQTLIARVLNKFIGMFLFTLGLSVFCWGYLHLSNLIAQLFLYAFFALITLCRANQASLPSQPNRALAIATLLSVVVIALSVFFPYFRFTSYTLTTYLSTTLFPWYMVMILTLVFGLTMGLELYLGESRIDEDTIFLSGLIGLVWVVKASVFYYFQLSWIAICVYTILFLAFTNRFVKRTATGQQTYIHFKLTDNEPCWILIAALGTIVSVYLIHTGYIYFWLSLLIGVPLVLFLRNISTGWVKDTIFWTSVLFSIALSTSMISLQNGYGMEKIIRIAAIFVFTSIIMLMLNYRNEVGRNKFRGGKIAIVLFFALLTIICAYRAGADITVKTVQEPTRAGSWSLQDTQVQITVTADGNGNRIKGVRYVWSNSFLFDEAEVVETTDTSISVSSDRSHLIVWAEDANGVVTRSDHWFRDIYRNTLINEDMFWLTFDE